MKSRLFSFLLVTVALSGGCAHDFPPPGPQTPGPNIAQINYDALYRMPNPPRYEPFEFYGAFLFAVANQTTTMALNPRRPTPDSVEQTLDVGYKAIDGIRLGLDIYRLRADETPNPLILIIHGGAWEAGGKQLYRPYGIEFAAMGYTVASINYRLSGQAPFPAAVEDIRDAIAYLGKQATEFDIDPSKIVLFGSSAGGHLAAFAGLAANTPDTPYLSGINAATIKAVISIYGAHDLTTPDLRNRRYTKKFMGGSFADAPEVYREASTINHVDKDDPPVLLIHGTLDNIAPVWHSDTLAKKLQESQLRYTYDRIEGWPHGMDFFSPIGERTLWQCYQFLKAHVPSETMSTSR